MPTASEALDSNGAHSEAERLLRCVLRDARLMVSRTLQQPCPRRCVAGQSPGQPYDHQHGRVWSASSARPPQVSTLLQTIYI